MEGAGTQGMALIITAALVVIYLGVTTWLTVRYRARTSEDFMVAARSVPAIVIGFLLFGWGLAKKLYASGEYTISAAIAKKYGRSTQLTVSLIMIYALLLVLVAQYVSGAA